MGDFLEGWENRQNSIIVFAGVFDPVHNGHLSAAEKALYYGSQVVFLPERVPQHKHSATAYEYRLNMLRIATEDNDDFVVLDYPNDHHWVVETFEWLKLQYPGKKFVWLIGNDVEEHISAWPGSEKLKELGVELVLVMKRDYKQVVYLEEIHGVPVRHLNRVFQEDEQVNSTQIRLDVEQKRHDIPEKVYDYIKSNNLYSFESSST
jgi:nicotinate-nucleotide adenylyltransferase